jgi:hypothetical protein
MKKLVLLIAITLTTLIASSQTATQDTIIKIPKPVAREIVKDIIRGDSAIAELSIVKQNYELEKKSSIAKDSIISIKNSVIIFHEQKEANYVNIIGLKDQQINNLNNLADSLNKKFKKEKRKRIFDNIISVAIMGTLTYLFITK